MLKKILAVIALVALVPSAHAFIDPPYLTPQHPTAGETVSVSIRSGICDAVGTIPGYPQIARQGNTIRIVLWGVSSTDPILCNFPIGIGTYAVGAYPSGSYTLQVDRNYQDDLGGIVTETLGVIPFTVAGGGVQPIALPASTAGSLFILGFTLFVVARTKRYRAFFTDRQGGGRAP
jgi:hypothetical protein